MKDSEIRTHVLNWYYQHRREGLACPEAHDFSPHIPESDILAICGQLADLGYLDWRPLDDGVQTQRGFGKITAHGVDVVESEGRSASVEFNFPTTQHFTFHGASNVQVGNHNVQHVTQVFKDLVEKIESGPGTPAEKAEAKSKLRRFLEDPLVLAIAGGLAGSLSGLLQ
jgi:hypothetical protein